MAFDFYISTKPVTKKSYLHQTGDFNKAACIMAHEVANEGEAIVCGSLSPVTSFSRGHGLDKVVKEFEAQLKPFIEHKVDFVLGEVIDFIFTTI